MPTAAQRKPSKREAKRERIELRVTTPAKQAIQRAMAVSGMTAGEIAHEGARRLLEEHEHMVLRGADSIAFLNALLNPPKPSKRLIEAVKRHRKVIG
jgi:uncharacterized protein (DUF1778 family)